MAQISGCVYRSGTKEGIAFASIKASKGQSDIYITANKNGEFIIQTPDPGEWNLVAFEKKSFASDPQPVNADTDQANIEIFLDRIAETEDEKAGITFFWTMLGVFIALIVVYLVTHLLLTPQQGFVIWSEDPLRYLEIILWGLAGIVVSKIVSTGIFLRWHHFYREGILMSIAHVIVTPIIVLIIVLLLTQVELTFTLANSNDITLNLSIPTVMVAFAFIIGTSPWPLWRFIQDTAKRFTGQLDKGA